MLALLDAASSFAGTATQHTDDSIALEHSVMKRLRARLEPSLDARRVRALMTARQAIVAAAHGAFAEAEQLADLAESDLRSLIAVERDPSDVRETLRGFLIHRGYMALRAGEAPNRFIAAARELPAIRGGAEDHDEAPGLDAVVAYIKTGAAEALRAERSVYFTQFGELEQQPGTTVALAEKDAPAFRRWLDGRFGDPRARLPVLLLAAPRLRETRGDALRALRLAPRFCMSRCALHESATVAASRARIAAMLGDEALAEEERSIALRTRAALLARDWAVIRAVLR